MERFNAACDWLSGIAFREGLWHWLPLQRRTYGELRGKFQLSAAALVAIRKVASAYKNKSRRTTEARFHPRAAIPVYRHSYKRDGTASLYGMRVPFVARRDVVLSGKKQAVLTYRHGKFILLQALESPSVPAAERKDYLGCDLGVVNLLTDSEGQRFGGREVEEKRRIAAHRRARLQAKQSRAAQIALAGGETGALPARCQSPDFESGRVEGAQALLWHRPGKAEGDPRENHRSPPTAGTTGELGVWPAARSEE